MSRRLEQLVMLAAWTACWFAFPFVVLERAH